jgi:hypothetical protein
MLYCVMVAFYPLHHTTKIVVGASKSNLRSLSALDEQSRTIAEK